MFNRRRSSRAILSLKVTFLPYQQNLASDKDRVKYEEGQFKVHDVRNVRNQVIVDELVTIDTFICNHERLRVK